MNSRHILRIVLIGYRCSGKTTVGRMLAERLGRRLIDTDPLIEKKAGCSIKEMVGSKGWMYFRELEKSVVRELTKAKSIVIAVGGGAVLDPENQVNLKADSLVFYLAADESTLARRMAGDAITDTQRPSLTGQSVTTEIAAVLKEREAIYRKAADYVIETANKDVEHIVAEILAIINKRTERPEELVS